MKTVIIIIIIVIIIAGIYLLSRAKDKDQELDNIMKEFELEESDTEDSVQEFNKEIIEQGTGEPAQEGETVTVHYTGTLLDGTKFDSSVDRGTPFSFTLGQGRVIKGWEMGLLGAKKGEKMKLVIPSDLAYGDTGKGPIPPKATLMFEIQVLGIK